MRAVVLAAAALLLAGCAAPLPRATGPQGVVDLATLTDWRARGRLAVAAEGSGGSGSFDWQQSGSRSAIRLQGPAGIGGLHLVLDGNAVRLSGTDGSELEADAAWAELEARLGAPVPARSLRYWMLGLQAPGEARWISRAPPATLEQDGWRIVFERTVEQSGVQLPGRLTATQGSSRVRLVIDRWTLGAEQG